MTEDACSRDACERPVRCKGLCASHYSLMRRNHPDRPRCTEVDCERAQYAKGLCELHRMRQPESRDSHREVSRRWAQENKQRGVENARRWIAENPERARELRRDAMRRWRDRNPEQAAQAMRDWIAANPDRWAELRRNGSMVRRARKRNTQVGPVDLAEILAEHGMNCHICSGEIASRADLHFDHVVPLARNGPHTPENIRPAHAVCNLKKGARAIA